MLARDTPSLGSGERWSAPSQDRKLAVVVAGAPSPVLRALPASALPRVSAGWALCALGPSIRGGGRATGRNDHGLSGENHTRLSPYGFQGTTKGLQESTHFPASSHSWGAVPMPPSRLSLGALPGQDKCPPCLPAASWARQQITNIRAVCPRGGASSPFPSRAPALGTRFFNQISPARP